MGDGAKPPKRKVGGRKKRLGLVGEEAPAAPEVLDPIARLPFAADPELRAILRAKKAYRDDPTGREIVVGGKFIREGMPAIDVRQVYRQCHRLAAQASPWMLSRIIDLALHANDERVASVCAIAVLDRFGMRPREQPERDEGSKPAFDPRQFNERDLTAIELGLRLMLQGGSVEDDDASTPDGSGDG